MKFIYCLLSLLITLSFEAKAQWSRVISFPVNSTNDLFIDNNTFYVSTTQGGFYRSTDGAATWAPINTNLSGDGLRAHQVVKIGANLWGATVDGVYKSTDDGNTWVKKSNGMVIGGGANNLFAYSVYHNNGNLYSGTHSGLYRSTDGGENWVITSINIQHTNIHSFAFHNNTLFAGRDAINMPILYKSTDNGLNWTTLNVWGNMPVGVICFWENEPGKLFIGTGHGMWVSTNNGTNWEMRNEGLSPDPYVSSITKSGNTMIASLKFGGSGVYKTSNEGLNWTEITDNLPFLSTIDRILIHNNTIYIATSNGLWKRSVSEITGITQTSSTRPAQYHLAQNYPNPFNPQTTISYSIIFPGKIGLKVYDINGSLVRIVVDEHQDAGSYTVEFDGSTLSSGMYFYKLEAGEFTSVRKMMLVK